MNRALGRIAGLVALSATAALLAASPASAIPVSGKQTIVSEKKGTSKMAGGLIGQWAITSFKVLKTKPVIRARGTESFDGCLDVDLDGSCSGNPSGTLAFSFRYWGKTAGDGSVQLGTCAHPVVSGTGSFAGATGFLQMVDTPTKKPPFTKTTYEGEINLAPGVLSSTRARYSAVSASTRRPC
jgi:hypothetical protein